MKSSGDMAGNCRAALAALVVGSVCVATARTVEVTENKDEDGVTTSINLTFSEESPDTTNSLYVALGTSDGGTDLSAWNAVQFVGNVPGDLCRLQK